MIHTLCSSLQLYKLHHWKDEMLIRQRGQREAFWLIIGILMWVGIAIWIWQ